MRCRGKELHGCGRATSGRLPYLPPSRKAQCHEVARDIHTLKANALKAREKDRSFELILLDPPFSMPRDSSPHLYLATSVELSARHHAIVRRPRSLCATIHVLSNAVVCHGSG